MLLQGTVGPTLESDGVTPTGGVRQGKAGDIIVTELHGRFYEQCYRGALFSISANITALSANTIVSATGATGTPIVGVWNPLSSSVNLVILQASVGFVLNTLTAPVGPGPMVWMSNTGQSAISTGVAPFNRRTLVFSGSQAKGFNGGVALTAMTGTMAFFEAADFPQASGQTAGTITASTASSSFAAGFSGVQNFDGSLIVPPGGVLGLYNTTSTTTYSAAARLLWEEVPV